MAKFAAVCAVILLGIPLVYLAAESPETSNPPDQPKRSVQQPAGNAAAKDTGTPAQHEKDGLAVEDPQGQTVRLTFTIKNDDGEHTHAVLCAGRTFLIEHDIAEDAGGHQLKIRGLVKAVDRKDRVFVQYDLLQTHSNFVDGFDATFKLRGSATPTFGKKLALGNLGDQQISLTVSLAE